MTAYKINAFLFTAFFLIAGLISPSQGWPESIGTAAEHFARARAYKERANTEKQVLVDYLGQKEMAAFISRFSSAPAIALDEKTPNYKFLIAQQKAKIIELNQLAEMYEFLGAAMNNNRGQLQHP